jgi:hypothetical protein
MTRHFWIPASLGLLTALSMTQVQPAAAQEWANAVVSFAPGNGDLFSVDLITNDPCRGSARPIDVNDALGPADNRFASLGDTGIIVLSFPHPIADLAGPDFRVWVSCNIDCEPAMVSASQDGLSFVDLGGADYPFVAYDLAGTGLASVMHVKVQDLPGIPGFCTPGVGLATDLDGIESLHPAETTPVESSTWGVLKAMYR